MLASGPGCRRWPQLSPGRGPSHQGQPLVQALGPTLVPRGRPAWRTPAPAWSRSLGGGEPCPRLVHAGPPLTEPTRGGEGLLGLSCLLGRCSCHSAHIPQAGAPTQPVLSVFAAQRETAQRKSHPGGLSRAGLGGAHVRSSFSESRADITNHTRHHRVLTSGTPGTATAQGGGGSGPPSLGGPERHASSAPSAWPGHGPH